MEETKCSFFFLFFFLNTKSTIKWNFPWNLLPTTRCIFSAAWCKRSLLCDQTLEDIIIFSSAFLVELMGWFNLPSGSNLPHSPLSILKGKNDRNKMVNHRPVLYMYSLICVITNLWNTIILHSIKEHYTWTWNTNMFSHRYHCTPPNSQLMHVREGDSQFISHQLLNGHPDNGIFNSIRQDDDQTTAIA